MHNMFYFPGSPFKLLVCNGLSQTSKASCDSWTYGESKWKHHSYPNVDERYASNERMKSMLGSSYDEGIYHMGNSGRYAASSYSWQNEHSIVGGMLNEGNEHKPTNDIRIYKGKVIMSSIYGSGQELVWRKPNGPSRMKINRALFCIAQVNVTNFVAIGGHSGKIEKSVETLKGYGKIPVPDMQMARNGHSCAGIKGGKILVSGGSDTTHRSGGKALKSTEMYSADTNQWEMVGDMVYERFGHALLNIGGRIIALGGKEWNPDVTLRNGEEFNPVKKTWTSLGDVMAVPRSTFGYALIPASAIPGCNIQPSSINVDGDIH